jgi:hypothetical protein
MADGKTQSEKVEGVARDLQREEADPRWGRVFVHGGSETYAGEAG